MSEPAQEKPAAGTQIDWAAALAGTAGAVALFYVINSSKKASRPKPTPPPVKTETPPPPPPAPAPAACAGKDPAEEVVDCIRPRQKVKSYW